MLTISSKADTFEVIEAFSKKYSTYTAYYKKVKCKKCGTEKTIRTESVSKSSCSVCKREKHVNNIVGTIIGIYEVLGIDRIINNKTYYKLKCQKCNTESTRRNDGLKNAKTCSNCKTNGIMPSINAPKNAMLYHYKNAAKTRNLEFCLTNEQFDNLITSKCYYCGVEPSVHQSDKRYNKTDKPFKRNGIDRKDSSKGYTVENTVPCCKMCNKMKMDYSITEWLQQIGKIYKNVCECSTTIPEGSTSK